MAKTKKTDTIKKLVNLYATGVVRRSVLEAQVSKNEGAIRESANALVAHVRATRTGSEPVAFRAENGRTLLVQPPSTAMAAFWGEAIRTIEPGALEVKKPDNAVPKELRKDIETLLEAGDLEAAQKLLAQVAQQPVPAPDALDVETINPEKINPLVWGVDFRHAQDAMAYWGGFVNRWSEDRTRVNKPPRELIQRNVFNSATMGPIRLSMRAKKLLQENRVAIQEAVAQSDYNAKGMQVSKSRGRIAQYLSEMETEVNRLRAELDAHEAQRS